MMEQMIKENAFTFKTLEKEIFRFICEFGREITRQVLETYDLRLKRDRDKSLYRNKGFRTTTIKTIYGEVTYQRTIYETFDKYGAKRFVYLLDENLKLENIGLVSENVVEQIVSSITEMSYRNCAKEISEKTGQSISAMGIWNIIQSLGEKLEGEENELVAENKAGHLKGTEKAPVLFEEADGVWLSLQGEDKRKRKFPKAEMKLSIAYNGWVNEGQGRYRLNGKVVTAGFTRAKEFHKIREAQIAKEYDLDETEVRILNGDGAQWIKKVPDKSTVFQLDPFHRNKSIRENISHAKARRDIYELLEEGCVRQLFDYLEIYRDSLEDEEEIEKAETLITYFRQNEDGLLPYDRQGLKLPESPEGLEYRNMGTMENHVWSIVARRMKHNHTSWSIKGGNSLAKILAKKCAGKLYEVTERMRLPVFEEETIEEIKNEMLTAAQSVEKIGKGYEYPVKGHFPMLEAAIRGAIGNRKQMAGY